VRSVVASVSTGAFAGFLSSPGDRVKTLVQGDLKGSYSPWKVTRELASKEGFAALWKGAGARATLVASAMLVMGEAKQAFPAYYPDWMHKKM
jgi:hypothetical protein